MVRFKGHVEDRDYHALDLTLLRRIWPFVRPYRWAFLLCLLSLFLSFGLEALRPELLKQAIDGPVAATRQGAAPDHEALWRLGAWFLGASLLTMALGYAFTWTTTLNAQRVIRDLRSKVFRHLQSLSPRYFDGQPAGKLVTRVTTDIENLNELIATGVLQTAFDLIKICGILPLLFFLEPRLAWLVLASLPVMITVSLVFRRFARDAFRRVRGEQARLNGFAAEAVGGVVTTRAFGQEDLVQGHFEELNERTRRSWLHTVLHFSLFFAVVELVIHLTQLALLWTGGEMILAAEISAGEFIQIWLYLRYITEPIKQLGEKYNVLQSSFAAAERVFQILDTAPEPQQADDAQPSPRGPAHLKVEDLHYSYRPGTPVLRGVDLELGPGQTLAIVGPTGAGKTTLLSMLSRMQDPDRGRILLDGVDLRALRLDELRRRVGVVAQDVFLLKGSILENIRLFDETISPAAVEQALRAVGAWDLVQARPDGLDFELEERGGGLSQGERQLLSFARALAHDPDLLVLDEATASIDSALEQRLQQALQVLLAERSCILVAHRLSTVRDADQILVMEQGQIRERGNHQELLARGGSYAAMLRAASQS